MNVWCAVCCIYTVNEVEGEGRERGRTVILCKSLVVLQI
jgi:hypothetical protein